jgi:uncharacterized membrane protein
MVQPDDFFRPSRFMRWTLVPVLVGFAVILPLDMEWTPLRAVVVATLSSLALLYAAALVWPRRCAWAARAAAAIVFLAYVAYFVDEWVVEGQPLRAPRRRSESSPGNALLGLIVIGLPALLFALRRRRASWEEPEAAEDDTDAAPER